MGAMKFLRITIRIPTLILASVTWYLFWMIGKSMTAPFPKAGRQVRRRWRKFILNGWGRSLASIMGMRVITGGEPPQPPFLMVSNHLSYVDIIAYAACLECVFVS